MNVYEIVTNRIMELLKAGTIPWRKPWQSSTGAKNLISKRSYRGINQFLLNCAPYSSSYWMTFKQVSELGGRVRKGERSTLVVFWTWLEAKDLDQPEEMRGSATDRKIPFLRYYNVFNWEQTDGISRPEEQHRPNHFQPIDQAEKILAHMPNKPAIHFGGDRAFYNPAKDHIRLPDQKSFHSAAEFYSTAFHELGHATGHSSRLNRQGIVLPSYFGSHDYSQEELVAEFTASMLCGVAGIEQDTINNSAAYIQGWLNGLKNDKKLAVVAAGQAQKAADYILGSTSQRSS